MCTKKLRPVLILTAVSLFAIVWISTSEAQKATYVALGSGATLRAGAPMANAVLWEPTTLGSKAHIGLVYMHAQLSYVNNIGCRQLANRGYRILCIDSRFTNNPYGYKGYEDYAPAIREGINYLRSVSESPAVTKVILLGHSIGGPVMAFYQDVAQNGPGVCQGPEKLLSCDPADLASLPAADGLVLLDSHMGNALGTLTNVDPAIVNEKRPSSRDSSLDMFDPKNGYNDATRSATYSADFIKRFLAAQARRNAKLIAEAQRRLSAIQKGTGDYRDDEPFLVPGAGAARLWQPDLNLLRQTRGAHTLLKADGTTPTQTISSVRVSSGQGDDARRFNGGALPLTVRRFLGAFAIRTTPAYNQTADDITGIDYASSNTSAVTHVERVTVPLLIVSMAGHYFIRPDEIIFEHSASSDKTLVYNEGATHGFTPCTACATRLGLPTNAFGDTVKRLFDYIDGWLSAGRFQ